jgi:hypothetical protein
MSCNLYKIRIINSAQKLIFWQDGTKIGVIHVLIETHLISLHCLRIYTFFLFNNNIASLNILLVSYI